MKKQLIWILETSLVIAWFTAIVMAIIQAIIPNTAEFFSIPTQVAAIVFLALPLWIAGPPYRQKLVNSDQS